MIFGSFDSHRSKIFVLGDSFTEGSGVNESAMYYNAIKNAFDAEMFIYAGKGYGTLQEYLVLEKYIDKIKPDLIILQTCGNDLINNSWDLEMASYLNNNRAIRPYLINGKIEYRYPRFFWKQRAVVFRHSRFFYWLSDQIENFCLILSQKGLLWSAERRIYQEGRLFPDFQTALATTNKIVSMIKERSRGIPIVAFSVDGPSIFTEQMKIVFNTNGIVFIEDVPILMRIEEKKGTQLKLKHDTHWNEQGQLFAGKVLVNALRKIIPASYQDQADRPSR